ncbi:hypothetical protein [Nocardia cyriacigeorgica]|uniref:Uncharacterized protein n=1 Tax=Nocardia cyriacigeorgica TaxID=135487 RepID=A0A5R8NT22_9NOCA|nr:hypothetical protein [Nocardia cyriacigeorgica]TLF78634.1 hypothetical protein FEK34_12605 [Nocardia cyriacigeorgica]
MSAFESAQIARHTAIVLAGAASLSLTVVSGAYIATNMPGLERPGQLAAPSAPIIRDGAPQTGPVHRTGSILITDGSGQAAVYRDRPAAAPSVVTAPEATALPAETQPAPADRAGVGGRLGLGTTYVGARVAPAQTNTVSITLDTNALTVLSGILMSDPLRERLGVSTDPSGVTQMRTDVDTRRGEVTLVFSDPTLGEHALELDRNPAPGQADRSASAPVDSSTAPPTDARPAPEPSTDPAVRGENRTITA